MATKAPFQETRSLDEIRALLAPLLPVHAAFDGWNARAVASAAADAGVDPDVAALGWNPSVPDAAISIQFAQNG